MRAQIVEKNMSPNTLLKKLGIRPRKRWSQNFLVEPRVRDSIVSELGVSKGDSVLEIGPGTGVLTDLLVEAGACLTAVERDPKLATYLSRRYASHSEVSIVQDDFLKCSLEGLNLRQGTKVLSNLPYSVTSPILFRMVEHHALFSGAWFTMQKEVADRILAEPGGKAYGVLTLSLGLWYESRLIFSIPPSAFYPRPEVDSAFVQLVPRKGGGGIRADHFLWVVKTAFKQRRKRLDNSLLPLVKDLGKGGLQQLIQKAGVDPSARPEMLKPSDFEYLALQLFSHHPLNKDASSLS
jgi:16S rRNA (adenine1518-N6/adenine1519-N6)-dimethyltransferase